MQAIQKGPPPRVLQELQQTPGADWGGVHGDQKAQLRVAAIREQHGLCAYCMRKIHDGLRDDGRPDATIEHWHPRAQGGPHFAWSNLLAVCRGDLAHEPHCDKARGDRTLRLHPAEKLDEVESHFRYQKDGKVTSPDHPEDIAVLNLNHPILCHSRREVINAVLHKAASADLSKLRAMLALWEQRNKEYGPVARQLLSRAIQQREGRSQRVRGSRGD